jgi:hypothetical protein
MLAGSFRLVTARLIPGATRCKQTLLLATAILAGCGGSGHAKAQEWQTIRAGSFHFAAPRSWDVKGTKASRGRDFVQVATFPLARAYSAKLFTRVESELATRMSQVAKQAGGVVQDHRIVTVDGGRSHSYDVRAGERTSRYTFVFRGKREFLLLCSADAVVCDELAASFAAG